MYMYIFTHSPLGRVGYDFAHGDDVTSEEHIQEAGYGLSYQGAYLQRALIHRQIRAREACFASVGGHATISAQNQCVGSISARAATCPPAWTRNALRNCWWRTIAAWDQLHLQIHMQRMRVVR
eukprot:COSAG01_NODE_4851_length_4683_cov_2.011778_6_plen_123_part_00